MKRSLIVEVFAFLLMILFLYASVSKWLAFTTFIGEMNNQPFPNWLTPWITKLLPPLELLIAVALMFERTRTAGFYASLILMSVFSLYSAAVMLKFFAYVPCSCGGIVDSLTWPQNLLLNLFFVGISVGGILVRRSRMSKEGPDESVVISG